MSKQTTVHNDIFGQPLAIGDCVVFPHTNHMLVGTVTKLNPKMVRVRRVHTKYPWETNKYPDAVVKVQGSEVTMYLLKNAKSS